MSFYEWKTYTVQVKCDHERHAADQGLRGTMRWDGLASLVSVTAPDGRYVYLPIDCTVPIAEESVR